MKKLPSKVTLEDIDHILAQSKVEFNVLGGKLTHCMITLPSGFIVTGESSCVDPAEYKKDLGEKYARENAVQTLWMLEGYELSNKRMEEQLRSNPAVDLVFLRSEVGTLIESLARLRTASRKHHGVFDNTVGAVKQSLLTASENLNLLSEMVANQNNGEQP